MRYKSKAGTCDSWCIGCIYHESEWNTCSYIMAKGNGMRGCPAGAGCDKKFTVAQMLGIVEEENERKKLTRMEGRKAKEQQRLDLYAQGLNDVQIAKAVGTSKNAICQWRLNRNLPANVDCRNQPIRRDADVSG